MKTYCVVPVEYSLLEWFQHMGDYFLVCTTVDSFLQDFVVLIIPFLTHCVKDMFVAIEMLKHFSER